MSNWKFNWNSWNIGGKIIFVSTCLATISLPMKWQDAGFLGYRNGIFPGILFLCLYIYPFQCVFRNLRMNKIAGYACSVAAIILAFLYISRSITRFYSQTVNLAGQGVYLFFFASIGLLIGTFLYKKYALPESNPQPEAQDSLK